MLRPPRERPTACFCSPLFRPMPSGALSHASSSIICVSVGSSASGKFAEQVFPNPALSPAHKAVIDRRRRTILGRAIAPAAAALEYMHDPADHAAIVLPLDTAHIRRQDEVRSAPTAHRSAKTSSCACPDLQTNQAIWNQDCLRAAAKLMSSGPSLMRGKRVSSSGFSRNVCTSVATQSAIRLASSCLRRGQGPTFCSRDQQCLITVRRCRFRTC